MKSSFQPNKNNFYRRMHLNSNVNWLACVVSLQTTLKNISNKNHWKMWFKIVEAQFLQLITKLFIWNRWTNIRIWWHFTWAVVFRIAIDNRIQFILLNQFVCNHFGFRSINLFIQLKITSLDNKENIRRKKKIHRILWHHFDMHHLNWIQL